MRHRRPAERRQVDPLQRADQGRHRRRELSRSARSSPNIGRGAGARSAPRGAGRDRQAAEGHPDVVRVRRHRRPGRRRLQGRGPGQQVPGAHPRGRRDRARRALLRARRHRPRRRQDRPDLRHRDDRHRARAGRPRLGRKSAEPRRTLGQGRRKEAIARKPVLQKAGAGARTRASRRAALGLERGREARSSATCSC